MEYKARLLSDEEKALIHERTIQILEHVGVCIKSPVAFKLLKDLGAKTDPKKQIVYISREMVDNALETAPKQYMLGARNPTYDFPMPSPWSGHVLDGITTSIIDIETGEIRPSTKHDVFLCGRVFQSLDLGAVAWTGCSALDMPPETHCLHEFAAILQGTSKHIQFELRHKEEAKYAVEILKMVLGSDEAVINRKIASVLYCPVSPLTHDESMLEAYLELADYEIPVCAYLLPMTGLTSPASLFTTLCQMNAEVLSTFVIFQARKPGIPVIYGACSGTTDPRTGEYVDGDECVLIHAAAAELAKWYGLPCEVCGGGSYDNLPGYLAGADLIDGFGTINNGLITDLEMMVIHNEISHRINRIKKGISIGPETDLIEDLLRQGPGGSFLGCKSTGRMFRNKEEFYYSKAFPNNLRRTYDEQGDMRKIANKYIRDLLAQPVTDEMSVQMVAQIDEICNRADSELRNL